MSKHVENRTLIKDLKPHQENIHVVARVIDAQPPYTIQTRRGTRTISNAVLGDETGRVKTTLWGRRAGSLKKGVVVEIEGAWTTSYRGEVQLNIGSQTSVKELDDDAVPSVDEIPEYTPKAPQNRGYKSYRRTHKPYKR